MNKKEEALLQLIVIDDSSNDAETVSNMLRNSGHVVHSISVEDDEDLREAIKAHNCDIVLSKPEVPLFSALDAINLLRQLGKDFPVVILNQKSSDLDIELLNAGARDYVSLDQPDRLTHVLLREQADARARRRCTHIEQSLEETNIRAQGLVDSSRDAIAYVHEGMHIYANDSYAKIFGHTDAIELEGTPIMDMVSQDDHVKFKEYLRSYLKGKAQADTLEVTGLKLGGGPFGITMEFSPASFEGETCIQIIIRDQSSNKELEQKLNELSKQDLVTGTYNRQCFMERLDAVAGKETKNGTVLYISLDKFGDIREKAGLSGRDLIIADLANLLKPLLTDENTVLSRYEAHMFAVLLPGNSIKQAEEISATIVKAIEDHVFDTGNETLNTTCSIGIAQYNEAIENPQEVITRVTRACQKASDSGGNCFHVYNIDAADMEEKELRLLWTKRLKTALRDNSFRLLYQPIVSLTGDPNENYQVLLRMLDEQGNEVLPGEFFPAAADTGLEGAIDRWVLSRGVKSLSQQRRAGKPTNFFVKISGTSLKDPQFLPWLAQLFKAAKLESGVLTLEVGEQHAQSNLKMLKSLAEGLQQLHIRLAITGFGEADNPASIFKHCNPQFIKLSGRLVNSMASDPASLNTVKDITAAAKEVPTQCVAEFVEDASTLAVIYSCGIDYIQGYFLQQPSEDMNYDFSAM